MFPRKSQTGKAQETTEYLRKCPELEEEVGKTSRHVKKKLHSSGRSREKRLRD